MGQRRRQTAQPPQNIKRYIPLFVLNSELMRNGCSLSKAVGAERFRLKEYHEMNGYLVAEVEYFQDEPIPPEKINECKTLFTRLELLCDNFTTANYCMDIEILLHDRPMMFKSADDVTIENSPYVERYSMWLASFLPLGDELRQYIVRILFCHSLIIFLTFILVLSRGYNKTFRSS